MMLSFRIATVASPIGPLALAVSPSGLVRLNLEGDGDRVAQDLARRFGPVQVVEEADPDGIVTALRDYFEGNLTSLDSIRVDPGGTPFQSRVWLTLRKIPVGETWSYAKLATAVGRPQAVRAVGAANGANPVPLVLPCHRVIGSDGTLVGYGGGLSRKEWLLRHEQARFVASHQARLPLAPA
jgi:methylated-DNA-[protein]-cysteine S-methyltransferase